MYNYGIGVKQNDAEAVRWYTKASEQGLAQAQYNLGILYLIKKDMPTAFKWFTKAADQGYTYAQSALKKYF
jgi:TPR repeat protein